MCSRLPLADVPSHCGRVSGDDDSLTCSPVPWEVRDQAFLIGKLLDATGHLADVHCKSIDQNHPVV
jgi:hypothetical protein